MSVSPLSPGEEVSQSERVPGSLKRTLPWVIYPVTMLSCTAMFFLLGELGWSLIWATYVPVLCGAITITALEKIMPAREEWTADRESVRNDLVFMVVVQVVLPWLLSLFVAFGVHRWVNEQWGAADIWVHAWPIWLQVVLMIFLADFMRYWLHVASHKYPLLWRLHAVHHSPDKLYWLNVGRFHPVEKSLQFLCDAFPFILLGVNQEVLALYFVFYAVNGFFQHCNIRLHFGWLNYVISSAELHRWHHSMIAREANSNYGNNTIFWDLLFGTWYLPREREVAELGLLNRQYPRDFRSLLLAPCIAGLDRSQGPVETWREWLLNFLIRLDMLWVGWHEYRGVVKAARNPAACQQRVLRRILNRHRDTRFARQFGLTEALDIEEFRARLPVQDYESLRPYVMRQDRTGEPWLNPQQPVMYHVTSGTTGSPKFIPVMASTLVGLKKCQRLATYLQFQANPGGFSGRILGLVGPAFEGQLDSGIPFGSASGNLYRSTPKLAQWKYVLPVDVFEIQDYQAKYYTILRLALQERNVTYLGTANPSTLLRLLEVAVESRDQLLRDLEQGTLACAEKIPVEQRGAILRACQQSDPRRADELRTVLQEGNSPTCQDLWPFLKLVATWTGGSCGIALKSLKSKLPPDATLIDLGILASELCVSVTLSPASNAGLPTFWENFFEFVDVRDYEQHGGPFLTLDQLEVGQDYYLFVTTSAGLFRYAMHDIVRVQGRFEQTPLIEFLQKGAGVTSITGEKLYESQVLQAMREVEQVCGFRTRFYQFVADEVAAEYILYLETDVGFRNPMLLAEELDCRLAALNYEYRAKRDSRRLHPPRVCFLKHGTLDCYKQQMFKRGRSESQFKTLSLCYRRELEFDYEPFLILLNSDEQA
ncbi:MAG: GH3 auxin-responsive promoter family protein [Planctomycetaceae bacterium]|nr:GH3 auxin-responsive promoter family protein [Planctomycetaceae bacterium]